MTTAAPRPARTAAAAAGRRWRPPVVKRPWRSVRVRITVVATLVFALTFAGAAFLLVQRVQSSLEEGVRQETGSAVRTLAIQMQGGMDPNEAMAAAAGLGLPAAIIDDRGNVVAGSPAVGGAVPAAGPGVPPGAAAGPIMVTRTLDGDTFVASGEVATDRGDFTILAESPLASIQRSVETVTGILVVGTPLLVTGFAVMVWVLVGRSLRPVELMRAEVEEISHTTMHRRIHEPGTEDEVDRLAITMNEMLDRLEAASDRQRRFVSDASHELKTPLATIRTSMEVALRNPDTTDWPVTAQRVLDADRSIIELVANLLDLARLEEPAGAALVSTAPVVDLDEVVMAVVTERRGDRAAATVDASAVLAGRVRGDRGDLERLVRNLVVNAERHGGGRIAVALDPADDVVTLTVGDDGPGIAVEDRARVFDRFAVLDPSRNQAAGGTGLGLAIVKAIAERHGGTVAVRDSPLGGAELVVTLPAAP
jgi:signal transduction histidine kinase